MQLVTIVSVAVEIVRVLDVFVSNLALVMLCLFERHVPVFLRERMITANRNFLGVFMYVTKHPYLC